MKVFGVSYDSGAEQSVTSSAATTAILGALAYDVETLDMILGIPSREQTGGLIRIRTRGTMHGGVVAHSASIGISCLTGDIRASTNGTPTPSAISGLITKQAVNRTTVAVSGGSAKARSSRMVGHATVMVASQGRNGIRIIMVGRTPS